MTKFDKLKLSLRYFFQGMVTTNPSYAKVIEAMELGFRYHKGTRKDNVTPQYQHQLEICLYLRTLHHWMQFPVETYAVAFLHDLIEDYDVSLDALRGQFGDVIVDATLRVSKKINGETTVDPQEFFRQISMCPIASLVKGADRINNLGSMEGVFRPEKQLAYINEAEEKFLPMLKTSRRMFPTQEPAYENMKLVMNSQIKLVRACHQ